MHLDSRLRNEPPDISDTTLQPIHGGWWLVSIMGFNAAALFAVIAILSQGHVIRLLCRYSSDHLILHIDEGGWLIGIDHSYYQRRLLVRRYPASQWYNTDDPVHKIDMYDQHSQWKHTWPGLRFGTDTTTAFGASTIGIRHGWLIAASGFCAVSSFAKRRIQSHRQLNHSKQQTCHPVQKTLTQKLNHHEQC